MLALAARQGRHADVPHRRRPPSPAGTGPDLRDVVGQPEARWALEVAAAGGHHLLLTGPPGTGKTMLAERLTGLLPPLTPDESLEVTAVHSVAGALSPEAAAGRRTAVRGAAPHDIGGGTGRWRHGHREAGRGQQGPPRRVVPRRGLRIRRRSGWTRSARSSRKARCGTPERTASSRIRRGSNSCWRRTRARARRSGTSTARARRRNADATSAACPARCWTEWTSGCGCALARHSGPDRRGPTRVQRDGPTTGPNARRASGGPLAHPRLADQLRGPGPGPPPRLRLTPQGNGPPGPGHGNGGGDSPRRRPLPASRVDLERPGRPRPPRPGRHSRGPPLPRPRTDLTDRRQRPETGQPARAFRPRSA